MDWKLRNVDILMIFRKVFIYLEVFKLMSISIIQTND